MSAFEHVLAPGRIGDLELRNRVIMAPMGDLMSTAEGILTDRSVAYYTERARGGTGLVVTGVGFVTTEFEAYPPGLTRYDSDDCIGPLRALADSIHAVGGKVAVQLSAGMGRNTATLVPGQAPTSASDNPLFGVPDVICRPLETEEVRTLVRRFAESAARAATAGIDAIDIHGHTGYLIDQFMSSQWNRRTDEYGGSLENRVRVAVEIVQAVKEAAPGLPMSFRLSVDQRMPGGRTVEESQQIAVMLQDAGVDLMMADDGSYEAMDYVFPPYYLGDAPMVGAARALKSVLRIPVMAVGNLLPENAEAVLAAGDADFVGIGRALIADPEWTAKLAAGARTDIRPCIRCNEMCVGGGGWLSCAVNPMAGYERERVVTATQQPRRIAVVGAGPAGLEAARVAALRGHTVDVYDRADHLGGVLWPAATPEFKKELRGMVAWWERQLADLPVTVHLGVEITPESAELAGADEIVVATGTTPLVPPIPGIDGPNVVDVLSVHEGAEVGTRVVVAGGGLSGADLALELAEAGHEVALVEMAEDIGKDLVPMTRIGLMRRIGPAGVRVLTGHRVVAIDEKGLTAVGPDGEVHVDADTVVAAFGVRPANDLAEALAAAGRPVHPVGDCVEPAKVGEAINAGYVLALTL